MNAKTTKTDVLIVGAGLAGTSLAAALAHQKWPIHILERHLPDSATNQVHDNRPITLSYASHLILKTLHVWDQLSAFACPITQVHVSQHRRLGNVSFTADALKQSALGYVLPFYQLQRTLYRYLAQYTHIHFVPINHIIQVQRQNGQILTTAATSTGEKHFSSELVVGADGTHSHTRSLFHLPVQQHKTGSMALVFFIQLIHSHEQIAYECFTDYGVLAMLPGGDPYHYHCVWSVSKKQWSHMKTWSNKKWAIIIRDCFERRIGKITDIKRIKQYPLTMLIAQQRFQSGFVVIGNAAQTLYPVAAQGFNLGLRDAATLSEVLIAAREADVSLGDPTILKRYCQHTQPHQKRIAAITQGITQLFDLKFPFANSIRGFGLLAMDMLFPLKKQMAKHLMGLSGRLPRLAIGVELNETAKKNK